MTKEQKLYDYLKAKHIGQETGEAFRYLSENSPHIRKQLA